MFKFNKKKNFIENYRDVLPYMDSDGSRFFDWIYSIRGSLGYSTHTLHHRVPNTRNKLGERRFDAVYLQSFIPSMETVKELSTEISYKGDKGRFGFIRKVELKEERYFSDAVVRSIFYKGELPVFVITIGITDNDVVAVCTGDSKLTQLVVKDFEDNLIVPDSVNITKLTGFGDNGPITSTSAISSENENIRLANEAFYPFIDSWANIDELAEAFKNANSSVLVLIGPPGTGKTTLLRTLQIKMKMAHNFLVTGDLAIENPAMSPWLHALPDRSVVVFEDSDRLCEKRKEGNVQMAGLLQAADGVVSNGIKLIISTNLPNLNRVDDALIRPGRAFSVIHFRELTPEEANRARASIGLDEADFEHNVTLSEALNNYTVVKATSRGFGFIGQN